MVSIHDFILKELNKNYIYLDLMSQNLINLSELARLLQPKIQSQTLVKVSQNTIVTSLSRIKKGLGTETDTEKLYIDDIQIKYPISDIVFPSDTEIYSKTSDVHLQCGSLINNFLNVCIGSSEVNIFVNTKYRDIIITTFDNKLPIFEMGNLCSITLKFDPKFIEIPGTTYSVLRELAFRNINLIEVMSTYTEITLFMQKKYSQEVLNIIEQNFTK